MLAQPDRQWELVEGRLRVRPGTTWNHGRVVAKLSNLLQNQLDSNQFGVGINEWRVRQLPGSIHIPDDVVVPIALGEEFDDRPGTLAIFAEPLPVVIEVWSASTGDYDVEAKLPKCQQRGDLEIWYIHPDEQTLTSWVRQSDGSYAEIVYRAGIVRPLALPRVEIALNELFAR